MHVCALIAAHLGLNIHSPTLATLWSIILGTTIAGASVSAVRIAHGLRHLHVDLMQRAPAAPAALHFQPSAL